MKVKYAFWILSALLFWIVWPTDTAIVLANGRPGGTSGCVGDTWAATSLANAPSPRVWHTAVWTGTEMLIWGGHCTSAERYCTSVRTNSGGRYNPENNTWVATSIVNAPSVRWGHTAVWTGKEMLVWGGLGSGDVLQNTGGRYDPETDTWTAISLVDAPSARTGHEMFWTGTEMIVWGGGDRSGGLNTGGRYCASAVIDGQSSR